MSNEFIVRCPNCGTRNRLASRALEDGYFSCGHCKARLPSPAIPLPLRTKILRFIYFFLAIVFLWVAWPISAWLGMISAASIFLASRSRLMLRAPEQGANGTIKWILAFAFGNLSKASAFIAIGVALVCVAQIILSSMDALSVSDLWIVEEFLSDTRYSLNELIGFEILLTGLAVIVALSIVLPRAPLLVGFLSIRSALLSAHFILLGLTSFTFFSAVAVESREKRWMERVRLDAKPLLASRAQLSREILGAAWTEKIIKELPPEQRNSIIPQLTNSDQRTFPGSQLAQVSRLAIRLANSAPNLEARTSSTAGTSRPTERMQSYLAAETTTYDSPTLRQARSTTVELTAEVYRLRTIRNAAIEIVVEGLGEVLGSNIDRPLAKSLIEELVSSLARGSLKKIVPNIENIEIARAWVGLNIDVPEPVDIKSINTKWAWDTSISGPRSVPPDFPPTARAGPPHLDPYVPKGIEPHTPRPPAFEPPRFKFWIPR